MPKFKETLQQLIKENISTVHMPIYGVVKSFDSKTAVAHVRLLQDKGSGEETIQLHWPQSSKGYRVQDPEPDTNVIICFVNGDRSQPMLLMSFDPYYESVTREENSTPDRVTRIDKDSLTQKGLF